MPNRVTSHAKEIIDRISQVRIVDMALVFEDGLKKFSSRYEARKLLVGAMFFTKYVKWHDLLGQLSASGRIINHVSVDRNCYADISLTADEKTAFHNSYNCAAGPYATSAGYPVDAGYTNQCICLRCTLPAATILSHPCCGDNGRMDNHPAIAQALALAYRLATFATINLIDDAAILALMFC